MANQEEEKLLKQNENGIRLPLFEAPDGKILATGDMFRGPYPGITSDIDLENPGRKLSTKEELFD
jgi:hypothetical protein